MRQLFLCFPFAVSEKKGVSLWCQQIHESGKLLWLYPYRVIFLPRHIIEYYHIKILHLPSGDTETPPTLILWIC